MTGFPPLTICFVDSIFTFWFWILRERHISFFPGRRQVPCREQGHPLASLLYVFNTYCGVCHKIVLNKYVPLCIYISQVTVWVQNSKVRKQSCTCHASESQKAKIFTRYVCASWWQWRSHPLSHTLSFSSTLPGVAGKMLGTALYTTSPLVWWMRGEVTFIETYSEPLCRITVIGINFLTSMDMETG